MLGNLLARTRDLLGRAWAYVPGWVASPLVIGSAMFVAGVAFFFADFLGERTTLGTIVVGSPAIYTRERLVNDRFLQDAWLSAQLEPASGIQDSRQVRTERRDASISASDARDAATAPAQPAGAGDGAATQPRLSSRERLLEEVDYREVVRSLTIENQLDDRHDLNGNSLYRFKFDASVLPGTNTQSRAVIKVRLTSPAMLAAKAGQTHLTSLASLGSPEHVEAWRVIYGKWIESLRSRLNETHRELKQAFHANEFSHNDYAQLIAFLSRNLNVVVAKIPKCQGEPLDPQGQEQRGLQLSTAQHVARKRCVAAIVEESIVPSRAPLQVPAGAKIGEYLSKVPAAQSALPPSEFDRARLSRDTVEVWLNSFFASKTVKLVLGLVVPETSFVGRAFYNIPAFRNLARLTFFNGYPDAKDDAVFQVDQRVFLVAAIQPGKLTGDSIVQVAKIREEFANQKLEDFGIVAFAAPTKLRVSQRHLDTVRDDSITFSENDFREVLPSSGAYVASAEVGLLNFVRIARANVRAFTYGVTPKESADSIDLTLSTGADVTGQVPAGQQGGGTAKLRREVQSRSLQRRTAVVGFAGVAKDPASAEFGWMISPRLTTPDGLRQAVVQTPAQYSLSALVSIPSWWNKAKLEVTTGWADKHGTLMPSTAQVSEYVVDVPMDFEPLEALLLGIEQLGPELMESRLDPVMLTACRPGAIVIPGRRLWRSTKVTLGYQTADTISVLPNMKGIIARFDRVQNQMSWDEEAAWRKRGGEGVDIQRAVRVWTSQGSLTLLRPARIGIPAGTPSDCAAASAAAPPAEKPVASKPAEPAKSPGSGGAR